MKRKGKELEELITRIEKITNPIDAEIKSPDYIKDKITGTQREVDISIRSNVGLSPILIIIECRDRSRAQDTTWVEQLYTKSLLVGANKVIAVSKNGFTKPCKKVAKFFEIETRELNDISISDIEGWFAPDFKGFRLINRKVNILENIYFIDIPSGQEFKEKFDIKDKVFYVGKENKFVSLWELMNLGLNLYKKQNPLKEDGTKEFIEFKIDLEPSEMNVTLKLKDLTISVKGIKFKIETWLETESLKIKNAVRYSDEEGGLIERIEHEIDIEGKKNLISFTRNMKTGKTILSREEEE